MRATGGHVVGGTARGAARPAAGRESTGATAAAPTTRGLAARRLAARGLAARGLAPRHALHDCGALGRGHLAVPGRPADLLGTADFPSALPAALLDSADASVPPLLRRPLALGCGHGPESTRETRAEHRRAGVFLRRAKPENDYVGRQAVVRPRVSPSENRDLTPARRSCGGPLQSRPWLRPCAGPPSRP